VTSHLRLHRRLPAVAGLASALVVVGLTGCTAGGSHRETESSPGAASTPGATGSNGAVATATPSPTSHPVSAPIASAEAPRFSLALTASNPSNVGIPATLTATATASRAVTLENYAYWFDFGDGNTSKIAATCDRSGAAHNRWVKSSGHFYQAIGTYHARATLRDCTGQLLSSAAVSVRVLGRPIYNANGPDTPDFSLSSVSSNAGNGQPFSWSIQLVQAHDGDGWFTNVHVDWGNGQVSNFAPHASSVGGSSCEQSARLSGGYPHYHRDISDFPAPFDARPGATYFVTVTVTSDSCNGGDAQTTTRHIRISY
jgi:hypothetical protein